eukprot:m.205679 g.205679  ORF g.205679 m.205679 type:complete len:79 (-) comp13750_c0_seq4:2131-2367(-)
MMRWQTIAGDNAMFERTATLKYYYFLFCLLVVTMLLLDLFHFCICVVDFPSHPFTRHCEDQKGSARNFACCERIIGSP